MKYDLIDTTFMILIRVDSIVRLENLLLCIEHLQEGIQTQIVLRLGYGRWRKKLSMVMFRF